MKTSTSKSKGGNKNRSPKKPFPELCVRFTKEDGTVDLANAHLQSTGGYLYLVWRQGATIERRYLGKAPKTSTTPAPAGLRPRNSPARGSAAPSGRRS